DHEAEADADLRGGDGHHGEREDLARPVVPVARERDQREVASVQHQLEREEHDERVAPDQDAERAGAEQKRGHRDVPGDAWAEHYGTSSTSRSCAASGVVPGSERFVFVTRITPTMVVMRITIDVILTANW